MAKFKVGDKVRIINKRGTLWNSDGLMDKWQGKVMTIRNIIGATTYRMVEDVGENGGWIWDDRDFAEKINAPSIHITANGNTVHAVLKDGGKVIKRSKAVCAPSDTFDFETGARIAFDRLCTSLAENSKFSKPQTESKPKYYSGKVVCVKANKSYWGERLTVGKVYEIDNGAFVYGDGNRSTVIYTDLPNRKERFAHAEFIEFKPDKPEPHTTVTNITIDAKCTSCRRERINEAISTPKLDTKGIYAELERIRKMIGL